jgi:hypothetical protein
LVFGDKFGKIAFPGENFVGTFGVCECESETCLDWPPDEILETCPLLESVQICKAQFTMENWKPIIQALYKVQPKVTLGMEDCIFDEDATFHLQDFLHNSPTPVDLYLNVVSIKFLPLDSSSSSSSWLPPLLGPSL